MIITPVAPKPSTLEQPGGPLRKIDGPTNRLRGELRFSTLLNGHHEPGSGDPVCDKDQQPVIGKQHPPEPMPLFVAGSRPSG